MTICFLSIPHLMPSLLSACKGTRDFPHLNQLAALSAHSVRTPSRANDVHLTPWLQFQAMRYQCHPEKISQSSSPSQTFVESDWCTQVNDRDYPLPLSISNPTALPEALMPLVAPLMAGESSQPVAQLKTLWPFRSALGGIAPMTRYLMDWAQMGLTETQLNALVPALLADSLFKGDETTIGLKQKVVIERWPYLIPIFQKTCDFDSALVRRALKRLDTWLGHLLDHSFERLIIFNELNINENATVQLSASLVMPAFSQFIKVMSGIDIKACLGTIHISQQTDLQLPPEVAAAELITVLNRLQLGNKRLFKAEALSAHTISLTGLIQTAPSTTARITLDHQSQLASDWIEVQQTNQHPAIPMSTLYTQGTVPGGLTVDNLGAWILAEATGKTSPNLAGYQQNKLTDLAHHPFLSL